MSRKPKATPDRAIGSGIVNRAGLPVLLGCAVIVVALYGLFAMWQLAGLTTPYGLDTRILLAFREPGNLADPIGSARLESAVRDVTALGSQFVLTMLTTLAIIFLVLLRRWWAALFVLVTIGGGQIVSVALKALVDRNRPALVPHLMTETSGSFPSGHAMMSTVAYLTFAILLAAVVSERRLRIFFFFVAVFLAMIVGLSRLYLGVHWPSDVLAGWSVGLAWTTACWLVARWWTNRHGVPW